MVYSSNFLNAQTFTRKAEGGWYPGNNPADLNPTNFGIIQKTYDTYRTQHSLPHQSVQLIADDEVHAIYYEYWLGAGCDKIESISGNLAILMFDCGFNAGEQRAIKLLQMTVSTAQTGLLDASTLAHTQSVITNYNDPTLKSYQTNRYDYLQSLHNWSTYGRIWTKRLIDLASFIELDWSI